MADLDKGGNLTQIVRVYRGPTLGWAEIQTKPQRFITAAGTTVLTSGDSIVLVKVAGAVILQLPAVASWMLENFSRPNNSFEGAIWIKDLGGNAVAFPISVLPNGTERIDNLAQSFQIVQARQLIRLYPLVDQSGWFVG